MFMKHLFASILLAIGVAVSAEPVLFEEECTAVLVTVDDLDGNDMVKLLCKTPDFVLYEIPFLTEEWVDAKRTGRQLHSGITQLIFPEGTMVDEKTIITTAEPDLVGPSRRRLDDDEFVYQPAIGNFTVAVIRVESDATGRDPPVSAENISGTIFDEGPNFMTQFSDCSFGQLNFSPTEYEGVTAGVTSVSVDAHPGTGDIDNDFTNLSNYLQAILNAVKAKHGVRFIADYLMICLPDDTLFETNAIGFFLQPITAFNSRRCTSLSTIMHELGHNFNLDHASDDNFSPGDDAEYGDTVGMMGYSYEGLRTPLMCFNAAKTHQLGWFSDKTAVCTPDPCEPCVVDVSGFTDYDHEDVENVLLKIENTDPDGSDYFLTFNKAKEFNLESKEGRFKVIMESQINEGLQDNLSYLEATMKADERTSISGFTNVMGGTVNVAVTSLVKGVATIEVTVPAECTSSPTSGPTTRADFIKKSGSQIGGDPHITTWKNEHYEFHGQCDLVLANDEGFADGLGLDVHIRTKLVRFWSYIKNVSIRIGNDVLEIEGSSNLDHNEANYWINYEFRGELSDLAGFPITTFSSSASKRVYEIDLSSRYPGHKISIRVFREFIRVKFEGGADAFGNTVGLLGDYETGKTLARDGQREIDDFNELGNEWQVLPAEPKLFNRVEPPQFPVKCIVPEDPRGERRRRLDESKVTASEAEEACATLKDPLSVKDCVYDVLATQDLDMVGAF